MRYWGTIRRWLPVIGFFALLGAVTLYQLVSHLNSRVPAQINGEWDYYHFHWNMWWVRHAVLNGLDPFYTDMVLAPFTHNLTYHSLTASLLPLYMIMEPIFGHLRSANLMIWLFVVLTGLLMTGLMRRQGISRPVALLGGIALAFSPYMLDHAASGHLNLITVFWLPVALFLWEKVDSTCAFRWAALTGVGLWGMWMTDTLIVFWAGLLLAPYGAWSLIQAEDRRARVRVVLLGILALAVTVALAWVIGPLRQTLDFDTSTLEPARLLTLRYYSVPAKTYVLPSLGKAQRLGFERDETIGVLLVAAVWIGLFVRSKDRMRWLWLVAALTPLVFTLGPDVKVFGTRIPLPFRLVHEAFDGQMRTPIRFLPPAMTGLILFVAHTYDGYVRRMRVPVRTAVVAALVLVLFLDYGVFTPYPATVPPPSYDFYTMMRHEHYPDYDYVVIDVPSGPYTGWRLVGSHPEAMVYGPVHEKRMVSGLLSRMPLDEHVFFENTALMGWLTGSLPLNADRAAVELKRYVDEWPVGYVVVHQDWMAQDRTLETLAFFNSHTSLCFVEVEGDAVLYRTSSHPKGCPPRLPPQVDSGDYTIHFGEPGDEGFTGHGWYGPETIGGETARWAGGRQEALLYASLPTGPAYSMTFRATAFEETRTVKVVVGSRVAGDIQPEQLGFVTIEPGGWRDYTLSIPADVVAGAHGDIVLSLSADGMVSAAALGLSADERPLTVAYDWVRFRAEAE